MRQTVFLIKESDYVIDKVGRQESGLTMVKNAVHSEVVIFVLHQNWTKKL